MIYDVAQLKRVRTMTGHDSRVGALALNEHILTSGSRDRTILHRDVRAREHHFRRLTQHKQEVCGLKWNVDENQLA
jgi:cell division cycle 20-like protein 1 (cofactor of APC complex)